MPRGRPPRRVDDPELAAELQRVSAQIRRAQAQLAELIPQRDALIARALENAWPHAQIATVAGLPRGRVGQIAAKR